MTYLKKALFLVSAFLFLGTAAIADGGPSWTAAGATNDWDRPKYACTAGSEPVPSPFLCSKKSKRFVAQCYENPASGNCMGKTRHCVYYDVPAEIVTLSKPGSNPGNVYLCN